MLGNHRSYTSFKRNRALAWALMALVVLSSLGASLQAGGNIASAQGSPFALGSVVATTTNLNLREQPQADTASVAVLAINTKLMVIGGPFNDGWYWLDYNGVHGYANGKYLVLVDANWVPIAPETPTATSTPTAGAVATTQATTQTATRTPVGTPAAPSPVATSAGGTTPNAQTTPGVSGSPTAPAASATPDYTAPTKPGDYTGLWLGEMAYSGNVRSGPGTTNKVIKGWWVGRRVLLYQAATDATGGVWYRVSDPPEDPMWVHSSLIRKIAPVQFEPARFKGRWVNVNISQQIVTAYENGVPVKVTLCSTGKGKNETELGTWKIYWRLPKQTMEGGNKASGDYYKLKDVPFPQYFHISGEALHGTFWHDDFGRPHSHGCVNLSTPIAGWFYGWANIGTVVYVHN